MNKILRLLAVLAVIIVIAAVAVYLFLGPILEWAAWKAIDFVSFKLAPHGLELRDPDFERVTLGLAPSFSIKEFSTHMVMTQHNVFQIDRNFSLAVKRITLSLGSLNKRLFNFIIIDGLIALQPEYGASYKAAADKDKDMKDRLEISSLEVPLRLNFMSPGEAREQVADAAKQLAELAKYGLTALPMRFEGASEFVVRGKQLRGRLLLIPHEKGKKLVMDQKDFEVIMEVLGENLTATEFEIYCGNPIRMPRMLRIRDYASDKAREENRRNDEVPEDAYKHVLWAFLLVRAYDEDFSREVTDAHEIDPVGASELEARKYLAAERGQATRRYNPDENEKTRASVKMDLINNAIGREYARKGFAEESVLERTMSDKRVIRTPRELVLEKDKVDKTLLKELRGKDADKIVDWDKEDTLEDIWREEKRIMETYGEPTAGSSARDDKKKIPSKFK